ncbi:S8 family serine peptidase [Paenisporosarcina macmurdoensis]|uniref:S8 family serine peptidase n=1 Tax=Paenisporosarcina macmurdoensis TaxID=212659 RepID=A0ABW1L8A7_9BACL
MKAALKRIASVGLGISLVASPLQPALNVLAKSPENSMVQYNSSQLDESKTLPLSEDSLVIKYEKPLSALDHQRAGTFVIEKVDKLKYIVVRVKNKKDLQKAINSYQKNMKVLSVNQSVTYKTNSVDEDPKTKDQYHLSLLKINEAQKLSGKNKVTVAIIDTGIDQKHPELKGLFLPSYNVINPMNQTAPDVHGTHVTGILAGKKGNGIGGYGINPNVRILPIDVFDRDFVTNDYTIAQAILYAADHGAKVINMSLGSSFPSPVVEEAVEIAIDKGVTIVAAQGNGGDDVPNYPASYEGVIGVGSINKDKKLSSFSTYGASTDIVAPGEDIYAPIFDYEKKSSFSTLSGTSMATPVVAGVASLLLSKYPNLKPAQVEYILEHTATDLGEKGHDLEFGNGLVNPTAVLKFDIKKLPAFVKDNWAKKEILMKAEKISFHDSIEKQEAVTTPFEQHWVQFPVKKGESVQTLLKGMPSYDYKMMIHFYSSGKEQIEEVNDVGAGKIEGKLIQAPFDGTMAIGVKDVNGSYDDSGKKVSNYRLSIKRQAQLPEDDSTLDMSISAASLPFQSEPLQLIGADGDDDFFLFNTKDEQISKISIPGIPGLDIGIEVYAMANLIPPSGGEPTEPVEIGDTEEPVSVELPPLDDIFADFQANEKGRGEGEALTFPTTPQSEYLVKVTSKPINYMGYEYFFGFSGQLGGNEKEGQSSLLPYTVKIEGKILPPDEDGIPNREEGSGTGEEEGGEGEASSEAITKMNQKLFQIASDDTGATPDPYGDPEAYFKYISDAALPYEIGLTKNGYIQSQGDEDWFKLTATQTGIFQFKTSNSKTDIPFVEILKVENVKDEEGMPVTILNTIGQNVKFGWNGMEMNQNIYTGLKKGETYFVHYMPSFGTGLMMEGYSLSSKLLVANPDDQYEKNDNDQKVQNLPSTTIKANFAMPFDNDTYYLEGKQSSIYSVLFERGKASEKALKSLPIELFSPLYGVVLIYEDVNKNRKLDEADIEKSSVISKGLFQEPGSVYGSFKVEKGKNYIINTFALSATEQSFSLVPYELTVAQTSMKDEDSGSVVKNNMPSKPLSLKKINANIWTAKGHLNTGVPYGDEDWYSFEVKDSSLQGYLSLEGGREIDGVLSIYQNGKLVTTSDYYPSGQKEVLPINLKKGKYSIKVRDYYGNSTILPYTLKVEKK